MKTQVKVKRFSIKVLKHDSDFMVRIDRKPGVWVAGKDYDKIIGIIEKELKGAFK